MDPRDFLRVEGLPALVIALGGYFALDGPIWLLLALARGSRFPSGSFRSRNVTALESVDVQDNP